MKFLVFPALCFLAGAQPSPRRRSPSPSPSFDRRRYSPPSDDRRRWADDRRRAPAPLPPPPPPPPVCAMPHCVRCLLAPSLCDQCQRGYRKNGPGLAGLPGFECDPCAANCTRCDEAGKLSCDTTGCYTGFTNVKGLCYACSAGCLRCDSAGPGNCDPGQCAQGYGPRTSGCGPCTKSCLSCKSAGAQKCDKGKCASRYTNDGSKCSPCASSCLSCDDAGSSKCDFCMAGYFVDSSRQCGSCAANCRSCRDATEGGCLTCNSGFEFDKLNKCIVAPGILTSGWPAVGFTSVCVLMTALGICFCHRRRQQREVSLALVTARSPAALEPIRPITSIPSGSWRGYYTYGRRNHDVCEFHLRFEGSNVYGDGVDDVGSYTISGKYAADRHSISFMKRYRRGTCNLRGIVSEDNEGHAVAYNGRLASGVGGGFRGTWVIRNQGTNSQGKFHLWPAMNTWASAPTQVFQVVEDGECAVCMDRRISTCLRPCGHIALCSSCATELQRTSGCPICRSPIQSVLSNVPSAAQALRA